MKNFSHPFYSLSTDYELLKNMVKVENHRVPGWVYDDDGESSIWRFVEIRYSIIYEIYIIGTQGILYYGESDLEGFKKVCEKYSLHFITPNNSPT